MQCKSFSHFFNKKYWHIGDIKVWNFNILLANDVVNVEQPAPSKTNIPSSNHWWPCNSPVTTHCQIYDQTKSHMVKGINNAFDHTELCLSYKQNIYFSENLLVLPRNYFQNRVPGSNFLLPTQVANWIFRWQICYLLLLISIPVNHNKVVCWTCLWCKNCSQCIVQSTPWITAFTTTATLFITSFWYAWNGYIILNMYS